MSSKLPETIIRKAHRDDYDQLIEMGDVYEGKDYLAVHYHSYFDDPDIYPLVAEVDGKVVGFYMNHILDNGLTVIKRVGRVHPSYRGHGIFHLLSKELDKHRKEFFPDIQFETFGTTNRADRAAKEFQEKGFVEVIRKRILNMKVVVKDLKGLDNSEEVQQVTKMTYDDVRLLFANDMLVVHLFPKGVLFNWYIGYKILESNIKYIVNDSEFVLASTSPTSSLTSSLSCGEVKGLQSNNFTPEAINKIDILSCAHKHIGVNGLSYEIDIYTADGYEESMIKAHLIKHLCDFSKSTNEDGLIMVSFNSNVKEELILSYLKNLGIVEFFPRMEIQKVLFEKKL